MNTQNKEKTHKPVKVGDLIEIEVTSLGKQGDGVGKIGNYGFIVLVNGGIINKKYKVQITRVLSTMAFARILTDTEYFQLKNDLESQSMESQNVADR